MRKKIIGILVVTLLITTALPTLGLVEKNGKSEISFLQIEKPGVITTNILDVVDQQQTTYTNEVRIQELNVGGLGQSFKPSISPLTKVSVLWIKSSGIPEFAYYYIEIRSDIHSTSYLRKIQIDNSQIQTGLIWYTWDFSDLSVTVGNTYWIVCYASIPTIYTTQVKWCYGSPGDPYPNGMPMINYGPPLYWSAFDLWGDFCFKTYTTGDTNNPPNTPSKPVGPTTGNVGISYSYSTSTTDDDDDQVTYGFDWDGNGAVDDWSGLQDSGDPCSMSHSWSSAGTFQVKVKAKDEHNAESSWSSALTVIISAGNNPPDKPSIPTGPVSGKAGNSYIYGTSTIDPDGDRVYYQWDWGHEISPWDGTYNSGDPVTVSHIFPSQGSYSVKVKAKDTHGEESVFSDPLSVTMPKNKPYINRPFLNFLQKFPIIFPKLQELLSII
jgi:hypothetical protein